MKTFTVTVILFYLLSSPLYAQEHQIQEQAINKLIQKIKNSSPADRRLAMNQLKILLRTMNQETRKKVMLELQKTFASHHTRFGKRPPQSIPGRQYQNDLGGHSVNTVSPRNPSTGTPHTSPGRTGPMRSTFPGGHR